MAVDSKSKRLSVIGLAYPGTQTLPVATGAIDESTERLHLLGLYGALIEADVITNPRLQGRLVDNRHHGRLHDNRLHGRLTDNRLHGRLEV